MTGRIHSIQTLGALDGPGLRFVVFFSGCPLRCGCCHNPDTWDPSEGKDYTARELVSRAIRYREYFGNEGGITLSGGEPLMQASFAAAILEGCRREGIHTCLDTSGCLMNEDVKQVLALTDRVLLDIKYDTDEQYRAHVGCGLDAPLAFLSELENRGIATTLRRVIIPTLNDSEQSVRTLKELADRHSCVDKIELLPFRKLCTVKYETLGIPFPFAHLPEPTGESMAALGAIVKR